MNEIIRLQKWYSSQCNGEWEHGHGISITSCDNPGWWVKIDLRGTALEARLFTPVELNVSAAQEDRIAGGLELDMCDRGSDWLLCRVKDKMFDGAGDPDKLQTILKTFLDWAEDR